MGTKKAFWVSLFLLNACIIVAFWVNGSGGMLGDGFSSILVAFGRLAGLIAAFAVLIQFFLMGRMVWFERAFGLDKLSVIHHKSGKAAFYFLVLHPLLIITGYSLMTGNTWIGQFVASLGNTHIVWALIGLILFIAVIALSIRIAIKKLRYESWYFVHLLVYLAVLGSFWHQISLGTDLLSNKIFYTYWIALYIVVFASHIVFRFLRPIYNLYRFKFRISRIVQENHNTHSVYISGIDVEKFGVKPGQFMIFRFLDKKRWWQAHPFSLSMVPKQNEIRITVKQLGDFTNTIPDIGVGTKVLIDGPYGVFTNLFGVSNKKLLIAGGIGITPVRSLMEDVASKGQDVVLLYANKTKEDIVFRDEIDSIAAKYGTRVSYILSDEAEYQGEKGFVDEEKVKRLVPDLAERDIYICGPAPMMEKVIGTLKSLGAPTERLHYERFSLQ